MQLDTPHKEGCTGQRGLLRHSQEHRRCKQAVPIRDLPPCYQATRPAPTALHAVAPLQNSVPALPWPQQRLDYSQRLLPQHSVRRPPLHVPPVVACQKSSPRSGQLEDFLQGIRGINSQEARQAGPCRWAALSVFTRLSTTSNCQDPVASSNSATTSMHSSLLRS